ncbi:MAG: hypothetical protein KBT13_03895, partial [Bacteroidales bacterium]|nr:hypothetical protein [Candidatus Sodaliphilus limicaballi]
MTSASAISSEKMFLKFMLSCFVISDRKINAFGPKKQDNKVKIKKIGVINLAIQEKVTIHQCFF